MLRARVSFVVAVVICGIGVVGGVFSVPVGALEGNEAGLGESSTSVVQDDTPAVTTPTSTAHSQEIAVQTPVESTPTKTNDVTDSAAASMPVAQPQDVSVVSTALSVPSEPAPIPVVGPVIVSMLQYGSEAGPKAIELWNLESEYVNLADYEISFYYSQLTDDGAYSESECTLAISGYILPKQLVTFTFGDTEIAGAYSLADCILPRGALYDATFQVVSRINGELIERVAVPYTKTVTRYERKTSGSYKTGKFSTDFRINNDAVLRVSNLYYPPENAPIAITELFVSPVVCATNDTQPLCRPYIKIENMGQHEIDLSLYRLRSGKPTSAASSSNTTALSGIIGVGEFMVLSASNSGGAVTLAASEGTAWFEDAHGITTYVNAVTPYVGASLAAHRHKSWSYDPALDEWRWTTPSPYARVATFTEESTGAGRGGADVSSTVSLTPCRADQYRSLETNRCRLKTSDASELTPCKAGQYRSAETNRCRAIAVATSSLTPCRSDQYRSSETNRCRSLTSTSSTPKPCTANQFRNPETGRCKNIASATSTLQPCAPDQERNPATNRCRKKTGVLGASTDHPVEPVVASTTGSMAKWWVLGSLVAAASVYGMWEWRREIADGVRAVLRYGSSRP